jgi:hypothetical protein
VFSTKRAADARRRRRMPTQAAVRFKVSPA